MIKIISSHSGEGGSTEAFIQMTNALNNAGYPCTFYGPDVFHLDKCSSVQTPWLRNCVWPDSLTQYGYAFLGRICSKKAHIFWPLWQRLSGFLEPEDRVVFHNIKGVPERPNVQRFLLSCHEQHVFPLKNENCSVYDAIHFVSEHQRDWHNILDTPSFVLPNFHVPLSKGPLLSQKVGGVVGAIYPDKATHEAIAWALRDSCDSVRVFGSVADPDYFSFIQKSFSKEIEENKIIFCGFLLDKQAVYDSFSDLYMCSRYECLPNVVVEAMMVGKAIHIPDDRNYKYARYSDDHDKLLETWVSYLGLS